MENLQHTGRIRFVFEKIKKKYKIEEDEISFSKPGSYEQNARDIYNYLLQNFHNEEEVKNLVIELEKENY